MALRRCSLVSVTLLLLNGPLTGCSSSQSPSGADVGSAAPRNTAPQVVTPSPPRDVQELNQRVKAAQAQDAAAVNAEHALTFGALSYEPSSAEFLDKIQDSALALSPSELEKLGTHGFVISSRQGFPTFVKGYAAIYSEHLPVYVSADAILEAIHSSYDELLALLEQEVLMGRLRTLLDHVHAALPSHGDNAVVPALDEYLAVARSLVRGELVAPVAGGDSAKIAALYDAALAAQGQQEVELFGARRTIDTSQYTPRGHYVDTPELSQYFRAMMWLGREDFRLIETGQDGTPKFLRPQVDAMLILHQLLAAEDLANWTQIDQALQTFVGPSDCMVLPDVDQLVAPLGGVEQALTASDAQLQEAIVQGGFGVQQIANQIMVNGGNVDTLPLARSFALFGQRFVIDSHVFSQVVYDRTLDKRMMPNPLDVAFAALGNDGALPLLQDDLARYPQSYPGKLNGARALVDAHSSEFWESNLYNLWLGSLRALSPTANVSNPAAAGMPSVTGTEAWNRRILNTQLGSWAELRHDTLLYAKQSYSGVPACEFPDAYVDPYPDFYAALVRYAEQGLALSNLFDPSLGTGQFVAGYFSNLKVAMSNLQQMAEDELTGTPFTQAQLDFINDAVRIEKQSVGCTVVDTPDGWLADLYLTRDKSIVFDPTIADVHTQPADESGNTVGRVLHVATGNPRLLVTTIDTCQGPRAYVGAAFSYHEVVRDDFERLTDEQWSGMVTGGQAKDVAWMAPVVSP